MFEELLVQMSAFLIYLFDLFIYLIIYLFIYLFVFDVFYSIDCL